MAIEMSTSTNRRAIAQNVFKIQSKTIFNGNDWQRLIKAVRTSKKKWKNAINYSKLDTDKITSCQKNFNQRQFLIAFLFTDRYYKNNLKKCYHRRCHVSGFRHAHLLHVNAPSHAFKLIEAIFEVRDV